MRTYQQQENLKFMSHFKRKFVIRKGRRKIGGEEPVKPKNVELFEIRANGGIISTRCIQVCIIHLSFVTTAPLRDKGDSV